MNPGTAVAVLVGLVLALLLVSWLRVPPRLRPAAPPPQPSIAWEEGDAQLRELWRALGRYVPEEEEGP